MARSLSKVGMVIGFACLAGPSHAQVCGDCTLPGGEVCMSQTVCLGAALDAPCEITGRCFNAGACPAGEFCCFCVHPHPAVSKGGLVVVIVLLVTAGSVILRLRSARKAP